MGEIYKVIKNWRSFGNGEKLCDGLMNQHAINGAVGAPTFSHFIFLSLFGQTSLRYRNLFSCKDSVKRFDAFHFPLLILIYSILTIRNL